MAHRDADPKAIAAQKAIVLANWKTLAAAAANAGMTEQAAHALERAAELEKELAQSSK